MVTGVHIPARITHPIVVREFNDLADYQAGVGGMIEAVDLRRIDVTMYANEEGLLRGLEFNPRATMLWWYWVPEARQKAMIAGDVVLVGWPDREGNSTNLPDEMLTIIKQAESFRIEVQWREGDSWEPIDAPMPYRDYFDTLTWALIIAEKAHPHQLKVVSTVIPVEHPNRGDDNGA